MKGPGLRLDLDVRRLWECPQCGRRERFEGDVVSARCSCRDVPMRLVEGRRVVRKFPVPAVETTPVTQPAVVRETMPETTIDAVAEAGGVLKISTEAPVAVLDDAPADSNAPDDPTPPSADPGNSMGASSADS